MEFLSRAFWSPYLVGALIGLLNIATFLLSDKPISASSSYASISGMIMKLFNRDYVEKNRFYSNTKPQLDWGVMLVLGIVIGSFLSASLSGDFKIVLIPSMWKKTFSNSFSLRFVSALMGGVFLGVGSRWAGGCTSGHGISGTSQLSIISWIAAVCFFIGGIITAGLLYGF